MTRAEREQAAKQFRCPKCGHGPGWSCKAGTVRLTTLKHPHAERLALVPETTEG